MKKIDFKRILFVLTALVLTLCMCFAVVGCSSDNDGDDEGSSFTRPERAVDAFLQASYRDFDAEKVLDCAYVNALKRDASPDNMSNEEFKQMLKESMEYMQEKAAELENYSVTWDITDIEEVDKDELEDISDEYGADVEGCAYVEVEITESYEYDGETESLDRNFEVVLIQLDGNWLVARIH